MPSNTEEGEFVFLRRDKALSSGAETKKQKAPAEPATTSGNGPSKQLEVTVAKQEISPLAVKAAADAAKRDEANFVAAKKELEAKVREMERKMAAEERNAASIRKSAPTLATPLTELFSAPVQSVSPVQKPKEQRLKEILQLYLTNRIAPRDYHQLRAKILQEP